jgi:hypothetical protein
MDSISSITGLYTNRIGGPWEEKQISLISATTSQKGFLYRESLFKG